MSWTPADAVAYLVADGHAPADAAPDARRLGGGVSNHVIAVDWDGGCVVVKRPLPNLDVDDDWPADLDRVHNEAAAARAYHEILADSPVGTNATAPNVIFEDRDTHTVGFACAPENARMWKAELLDGQVDHEVATTVGRVLGTIHGQAADDADLHADFDTVRPVEQLRLDPYHRTVADRHPAVAEPILDEVARIADTRATLVHGDYSPKNVLVSDRVWILDFEVAHWGDPAFDVAFMTNHLLIKAVHCSRTGIGSFDTYVEAADRFRDGYTSALDEADASAGAQPSAAAIARELAICMLARVDGKSPVAYPDDDTATLLRRVSKAAIDDRIGSVGELVDRLREAAT